MKKETLVVITLLVGEMIMIGAVPLAHALPRVPDAPINSIDQLIARDGPLCRIFIYIFWFLIFISIIFILLAAYRYLFYSSDPAKIKEAHKQIVFAVVAVIVGLMARSIPDLAITLISPNARTLTSSCSGF